ncbi:hypothetical protein CVS40_6681 [Lucilia cuprina]|nr:hypothetical protein CVS40_6681 [Lucilia cuprina]
MGAKYFAVNVGLLPAVLQGVNVYDLNRIASLEVYNLNVVVQAGSLLTLSNPEIKHFRLGSEMYLCKQLFQPLSIANTMKVNYDCNKTSILLILKATSPNCRDFL